MKLMLTIKHKLHMDYSLYVLSALTSQMSPHGKERCEVLNLLVTF